MIDDYCESNDRGLEALRLGSAAAVLLAIIAIAPVAHAQQQPADAQAPAPQSEQQGDQQAAPTPSQEALRPENQQKTALVQAERTLELDQARQLARKQNLGVRLAQTQVDSAKGQIRQAYSYVLPRISASGNYIINQSAIGAEFPSPIPGQPATQFIVQPKNNWNWQVGATLPLSGRAYPGIEIAYGQLDRAKAQLGSATDDVDFSAVQLYYQLLLGRELIKITQQQLQSSQTVMRATQRRYDAGVATKFDLNRAHIRVVAGQKQVERARLAFVKARQALANLLQTPANFDVREPAPLPPPQTLEQLKQTAKQQRYSVQVDQINQKIADLFINEVYFQYLPTLSVNFNYSDAADSDFNQQPPQWQLVFGAQWTLWDGGNREGLLDERQAQLIASKLRLQQTLDGIYTDLDQAWADYQSRKSQLDSSQLQVQLSEQGLQQAQIGYDNGVTSQLDLIDAQDRLTIARTTLAQDRLQLELAIRRLHYLAGLDR